MYESIKNRRTIRKYLQKPVPKEVLTKCVEAARLSPNGLNMQPLRYMVVDDKELLPKVFSTLGWAMNLPEYYPREGEKPQTYIVIMIEGKARTPIHDVAIASMSISMVAYEEGLGTCIFGSVNRDKLKELLEIPQELSVELVVALGYPAEKPVVEPVVDGETNYWLDKNGGLHVPKRTSNA